jgi:kumamolisin
MPEESRVPIVGTHRSIWPGAAPAADLADGDVLLTAWLRPQPGGALDVDRARRLGEALPSQRVYANRTELAHQTAADPQDVELLRRYCGRFGIEIVETHWRSVVLSGGLRQLIAAFGATASIYELPDKRRFRHRSDALHAPADIAAILRGPFGIHQWPRSHAIGALHGHTMPLLAQEVLSRYQFPDGDGSGQTVGILQLRGTFNPADFTKGTQNQGVTPKLPIVKRVDNAELAHATETEKDVESAIDTQVIAALAPGAQIVVYAAPDDERGVLDAIRTALFDDQNCLSILSISFGFPESLWTPIALTILDDLFTVAALIGVSVFCASGDNGAEVDDAGRAHVLAPASSPFAHACGGTQVTPDGAGGEAAWENSGGGFSDHFEVPAWQSVAAASAAAYGVKPGRGVPDVAAQAMPGYSCCFEGTTMAMGGTSAVAPMWSALTARINQQLGTSVGFFGPLLYRASPAAFFRDVTSGGNDRYKSVAGWNPCTGLGVPIGDALGRMLTAQA